MRYDYLTLRLTRDASAQRALVAHAYGTAAPALAEAGGELLAHFTPVLGFASNEALGLVRWADRRDAAALERAAETPLVVSMTQTPLSETLRPSADARPEPGGVYIHNWFTVDAGSVDEFVKLSGEAWPDFEARFEAKIFGLFRAAPSGDDEGAGVRRLLLMTRYKDLGEWQRSRDPASDAMQIFLRRRELTRVSLARACALAPAPA